MEGMFHLAIAFNQPLRTWNVSKVNANNDIFTDCSISNANKPTKFQDPPVINTPTPVATTNKPSPNINRTNADIRQAVNLWTTNRVEAEKQYGSISNWDVSRVTDMSRLFADKENFNDDISRWNVSNVTNMIDMFNNARSFNQPIGKWNVSNVTIMNRMFDNARAFNQPIGAWNVSKVTRMMGMFWGAFAFNQPIGKWNVSNVTDMNHMFHNARSFNQSLVSWNLSKLDKMTNYGRSTIFESSGMVQGPNNAPAILLYRREEPASSGCVLCGGAKKTRRSRRTIRKRPRKGRRTQKRRARRTRRR
jgi:surface protein